MRRVAGVALGLIATLAMGAVLAAQTETSAKGIFVDNKKPGVKYTVMAPNRVGKLEPVALDHEFHNNDSLRLQFQLNRQSYIYVLNRTLNGDPKKMEGYLGEKGIVRIKDDDTKKPTEGAYTLLFPSTLAGTNNRLPANSIQNVPGNRDFKMDDVPGIEKLFILVSEEPLNLEKYFDNSGRMRTGTLAQLNKDLVDYGGNADVYRGKGIKVDDMDGYGVIRDGKIMVATVDLKHAR